jgi:hypothetical protein
MLYQLRTTFTLPSGDPTKEDDAGRADRVLRWLYEYLPTKATLGSGVALPEWVGNRYTENNVELQLLTRYRDVFAMAADKLRIDDALTDPMPVGISTVKPDIWFKVFRIYGAAELVDASDPSKKLSHPC